MMYRTRRRGGIVRHHGDKKVFGEADGLPGPEVTSFLQTSSGVISVGTNTGLAQLVDDKFVPLTWQQGHFDDLFAHSTKMVTAPYKLYLRQRLVPIHE